MLAVKVVDTQLQRKIAQWSSITGRTVKDETRTALKGIIKDAINYTPPGSEGRTGTAAKKAGESAIKRDLANMGFVPIHVTGKRKLNPKFSDPEGFRRSWLASHHGRNVTRGKPFYVDEKLFKPMLNRLLAEVGRLASGWVRAANELGVPVPAWISRHSETFGRGTPVQIIETPKRISMKVTNRLPAGTVEAGIAADMIRRIALLKTYAVNRLQRQISFGLKNGLRRAK